MGGRLAFQKETASSVMAGTETGRREEKEEKEKTESRADDRDEIDENANGEDCKEKQKRDDLSSLCKHQASRLYLNIPQS